MAKLYIYDSTSEIDKKQAGGRFSSDKSIEHEGISSKDELHLYLQHLIVKKKSFKRFLIQTHGNSGRIAFGKDIITSDILISEFSGKYDILFEPYTRMYFDGCNIAEGNEGWRFLQTAGEVFLKSGGGESIGWTTRGWGMSGWIPFVGGHTLHHPFNYFEDNPLRKVIIAYDGSFMHREEM